MVRKNKDKREKSDYGYAKCCLVGCLFRRQLYVGEKPMTIKSDIITALSSKTYPLTVLIISIVLVTGLLVGFFLRDTSNVYQSGYEMGAWHTLLYSQATGSFPSYEWRHNHLYDDLQTKKDIINTLSSDQGGK